MTKEILQEVAPLREGDVLLIAERHKKEFDYPIHKHDIFELNFVCGAEGVNRVVGDSSETIGNLDLVLITSPNLEHVWLQGNCHSEDIHEITVHFMLDFNGDGNILNSNPLRPIKRMCDRAQRGLAFPLEAILKCYSKLENLTKIKEGFYALREFFDVLYILSQADGAKELASSSFAKVEHGNESKRIQKVESYIATHYMNDIRLADLANLVSMSPSSFSRFFKLSTSKGVGEYIVDIRLGVATRRLVDTTDPVSTISYDCGFNTLSNFNRLFRKHKGCSPSEFREKYFKTKVIV